MDKYGVACNCASMTPEEAIAKTGSACPDCPYCGRGVTEDVNTEADSTEPADSAV